MQPDVYKDKHLPYCLEVPKWSFLSFVFLSVLLILRIRVRFKWYIINLYNLKNKLVGSDSAVLNLLERIKSPTFNPFKLTSLIIPKIKEHEIEFEEEAIENAEIHGLSTAEIKSFKYLLLFLL